MCWRHVINKPAQLYIVPFWGQAGGARREWERTIVGLMVTSRREEQPGEVVRSRGWFCTEDTAKVLRRWFTLTKFTR